VALDLLPLLLSATLDVVRDRDRGALDDLMEQLKDASPLGSMLRSISKTLSERSSSVIGLGTLRKLEAAGITTPKQVSQMKLDELKRLGITTRFAEQIIGYSRRRPR
jgi:hypothetical protein